MFITATSESSYYWHLQMLLFHFKCWSVVSWFPEQLGPSSTFCEGGSAWIVLWTMRVTCMGSALLLSLQVEERDHTHTPLWYVKGTLIFFKFVTTDLYLFLHPTQSFSQPRGKTYLQLARLRHCVGPFKVSFELLEFGVLVPFLSTKLGFS